MQAPQCDQHHDVTAIASALLGREQRRPFARHQAGHRLVQTPHSWRLRRSCPLTADDKRRQIQHTSFLFVLLVCTTGEERAAGLAFKTKHESP